MKAIILAAGRGKRLSKFTGGKPKCLLRLGKETILERELRLLNEAGISSENIYVVTGYRHEVVAPFCPNEIYNALYEQKDNSYSLGLALQTVFDDDVLILDADLCFDSSLLREIIENQHENVLLSKKSEDLGESTGIVTDSDMRVKAIGKQYFNTGYVYISIFKVAKETIPSFREHLLTEKNGMTWYPAAITEICGAFPFYNLVTDERWHEIDFEEDYHETLAMFGLGGDEK